MTGRGPRVDGSGPAWERIGLNQAGVPDHELLVALDYADKTMGALRYMGGNGTYFSKGDTSNGDSVLY